MPSPVVNPRLVEFLRVRGHLVLAVLIFASAIAARVTLLNVPFHQTAEGVGSYHGMLARNFLRVPLSVSGGVPVQSAGYRDGLPVTWYSNHPPLAIWSITAGYWALGEGVWQTRLPFAIATILSGAILYWLLRRSGRPRAGLFVVAIFFTLPMTLYFGGQPEIISAQLVLFTLLTLWSFVRFSEEPSGGRFLLTGTAFAAAAASDWPAFYLVPILMSYFIGTHRLRFWGWMVLFGLFALTIFVLLYAQIVWVATHDWAWILDEFESRTVGNAKTGLFTATEWWWRAWNYNAAYHTVPVLAATAGWIAVGVWQFRRSQPARTIALLLLVNALLHVAIGRQGCFAHGMWWWPLTPALAVAAGLFADDLLSWIAPRFVPDRIGSAAAIIVLAGFGCWNWRGVLPEFFDPNITSADQPWSGETAGRAIRAAAPRPDSAVLLVSSDQQPALWYYADRVIKTNIWTPIDLERRINDGTADLPFGFTQVWEERPVAAVVPKAFASTASDLVEVLQRSYREIRPPGDAGGQFLLFDLTQRTLPAGEAR